MAVVEDPDFSDHISGSGGKQDIPICSCSFLRSWIFNSPLQKHSIHLNVMCTLILRNCFYSANITLNALRAGNQANKSYHTSSTLTFSKWGLMKSYRWLLINVSPVHYKQLTCGPIFPTFPMSPFSPCKQKTSNSVLVSFL